MVPNFLYTNSMLLFITRTISIIMMKRVVYSIVASRNAFIHMEMFSQVFSEKEGTRLG